MACSMAMTFDLESAGETTFGDFRPSGNAAADPHLDDVENRRWIPTGSRSPPWPPWSPGKVLVDLGCGTGHWLESYAAEAARVVGVEPDPALRAVAAGRVPGLEVRAGSSEHLPLPDASVGVIHARFAYFFPPGCDAGLAEALRVLRPGGALVVVDNDQRHGEFAGLLASSAHSAVQGRAEVTDAWWAQRGAQRVEVMSEWSFETRADLDAVLHLELPASVADRWLAEHPDTTRLTYGYVLFATAPTVGA